MISIVVPVYNKENYIERCIKSITDQTYSDIEILIIDDGSTDGSGAICDRLAERERRIRVEHIKNGGPVAARKRGLSLCNGEYVGFVDADDYIEPDMYCKLEEAIRRSGADFVHSGFTLIKNGYSQPVVGFDEGCFKLDSKDNRIDFLRRYYLRIKEGTTISYSLWSKLYKREFIGRVFGTIEDNQEIGEDALCLCRCVLEANSIYLLPITSYNYQLYDDSLSRAKYERVVTENIHRCSEIGTVLESCEFANEIRGDIADFSISFLLKQFAQYADYSDFIPKFYCDQIETLDNKRVLLYGAGEVGRCYYKQMLGKPGITIVGACDSNNGQKIGNIITKKINEIPVEKYDVILVSVDSELVANSIIEYIKSIGIINKDILWFKPKRFF